MPNSLRSTINDLATSFASSVLDAIRQMSLDEILAETHGKSARVAAPRAAAKVSAAPVAAGARKPRGRLGRRSAGDIASLVNKIVEVLEAHPSGLRSEQIRDRLGLVSKELPRPLADALASRRITKVGEKRATTYFAKGAKPAAKAAGKPAAKPTAKASAKSSAKRGKAPSGGKKKAGAKRAAKAAPAPASA